MIPALLDKVSSGVFFARGLLLTVGNIIKRDADRVTRISGLQRKLDKVRKPTAT